MFTTLTKEAFPLVRYRSGDIASLLPGPAPAGAPWPASAGSSGRTDDMIFFEGVKFFPSQIEEVLLEEEGIAPHYRIVLDREEGEDTLEIQVEVAGGGGRPPAPAPAGAAGADRQAGGGADRGPPARAAAGAAGAGPGGRDQGPPGRGPARSRLTGSRKRRPIL